MVYFIYGDDNYLVNLKKIEVLEQINPSNEYFAEHYDLSEQKLGDLVSEFSTLPLFASKRIIVVENALFLTESKNYSPEPGAIDILLNFLANPTPTTEVIFTLNTSKISKRLKITKKMLVLANIFFVKTPNHIELVKIIRNHVTKLGGKIEDKALEYLISQTPPNLYVTINELERIMLISKTVSLSLLKDNLNNYLEADIFALTNLLLKKDKVEFLNLYYRLKQEGNSLFLIISLLSSSISVVLDIFLLKKDGVSREKMLAILKIHPYRLKIMLGYIYSLNFITIAKLIDKLYNFELGLKTGKINSSNKEDVNIMKIINTL